LIDLGGVGASDLGFHEANSKERDAMKIQPGHYGKRLLEFIRTTDGKEPSIDVFAEQKSHQIPATILGNFLEHLGFAIYGGLWAQLLINHVFHQEHNLDATTIEMLKRDGKLLVGLPKRALESLPPYWLPGLVGATGFGVGILDDQTEEGIPLPWAVMEGSLGHVYPASGRIGHGIRLNPKGQSAGIRQSVFLPIHRTASYEGFAWVRRENGAGEADATELTVGFKGRGTSRMTTESKLGTIPLEWTKVAFRLDLPPDSVSDFEPVDFFIAAHGASDVLIDRVELYPEDHIEGFDPEIVQATEDWKVPLLRGPGGNFVSGYHWRDGVGERDLRPTRPNPAWGGLEYNDFGTDEFVRFCRLVGAEPHICVNIGTGTAEEAAAWVEYCNGSIDTPMGKLRAENGYPEPYGIRYWEVGNEIYGCWQIGNCGSEENARRYKLFAEAMRKVDPSIVLIANGNPFDFVTPEPHWSFTAADQNWHRALLEENASDIEFISLHALPENTRRMEDETDEHAYYGLMAHPTKWERDELPQLLDLMKEYGVKAPKLAITEWGVLGTSELRPRVDNFGEVIYAGLFLNLLMRNAPAIPIANATALLHGGCIRKAGGRVFLDAQYFAIQLYNEVASGFAIPCRYQGPGYDIERGTETTPSVQDVPYLDVAAYLTEDGSELVIYLVNRHFTSKMLPLINLHGFAPDAIAEGVCMASSDPVAVSSPLEPERFRPKRCDVAIKGNSVELVLPPCSLTRVRLTR
jgi:alpha-N-arabinofuranosidase